QETVGIGPDPFRHGPLQRQDFVVEACRPMVGNQRSGMYQKADSHDEHADDFVAHETLRLLHFLLRHYSAGLFPSSAEEGWLRHQWNAAKPPSMARTGWCWSMKWAKERFATVYKVASRR